MKKKKAYLSLLLVLAILSGITSPVPFHNVQTANAASTLSYVSGYSIGDMTTNSGNIFYAVAMFSYTTQTRDDGSWWPVNPGTTAGAAGGVSFNYSFDLPYNKLVEDVEVSAYTGALYNTTSPNWQAVWKQSRVDAWGNYSENISSSYGASIVESSKQGLNSSSVSFTLKLTDSSVIGAAAPHYVDVGTNKKSLTVYFPMLLKIKVTPKFIVKYWDTNGNSLDSIFGNYDQVMVKGNSYSGKTPPTHEDYTYFGYDKTMQDDKSPSLSNAVSGNPPAFTYDGTYNSYVLHLYYKPNGGGGSTPPPTPTPPPDDVEGTIHVRHMVRTSSTGSFSKVEEKSIYVDSLPANETISPNNSHGTLLGRNQNRNGYSDALNNIKGSITVNLYEGSAESWVTFFYESSGGGGTPEPDVNHPPVVQAAWSKPNANVGDVVSLQITSISDPDYPDDWVEVVGWDFTKSTEWLAGLPSQYNMNLTSSSFSGITANQVGTHTVYVTVEDSHGERATASATLNVIDPKPIAIIDAPTVVKENRPLPSPIDGSRSYSPIGRDIVDYVWTNKQDKYPVPGEETVTLRVQDDEGRWSDLTTHVITVIPDEPPIVTLSVPPEETRLGTLTVKSNAYSPDGDTIVSRVFQYKYDANNDGFDNDAWQTYSTANVDSYAFKPTRVGKYLFRESVCEDYGKCGNSDSQPEAQRTADIKNLAPAIDVKTSGSITDPPETFSYLMSDLYATGRFVNLNTGAVGNKNNWKLENGILKTKTTVKLSNIGQVVQYPFYQLYNQSTRVKSGYYFQGVGYSYGINTLGLEENLYQAPFAGLQNNNATFQTVTPPELAGQAIIAIREDEKYTYIETRRSDFTGSLYVYNKSFGLVWSKYLGNNLSYGRGGIEGRINYGSSDGQLLIHNNTVYVGVADPYNYMQYHLLALDRDTGAEKHRIMYNAGNYSGNHTATGLPDGIFVENNKYNLNGQWMLSAPITDGGVPSSILGVSQRFGRAISFENKNGYWTNNQFARNTGDFSVAFDLGNPASGAQGNSPYTFLGFDSEGTSYGIHNHYGSYSIQRHTLSGMAFKTPLSIPDNSGIVEILGKDSAHRIWISTQNSSRIPVVHVYNADGQLLQSLYPFGNLFQGSVDKMFIGSDNVVTLFGMYYNGSGYQVHYASYNPDTFGVMASGATPTLQYMPAYIYPHDDQSFLIEQRGDASGYQLYLLGTSGSLSKPKLFEAGEPTPDIAIGASVPVGNTVRANFMPNNATSKGVGYLYRVQDDYNYYSIEFEDGQLRVKKTVGGSAHTVFSKAYPIVSGNTYEVMMIPTGSGFDVYINKLWQANITETGWPTGRFGVISRGHEDVSFISAGFYAGRNQTGTIEGVVLVGETITYDVIYNDPEGDPRLTAFEEWKYTHNPYVFLQPVGVWNSGGQRFVNPITSFAWPGEYTFTFKTKDDPHPEHRYPDNAFDAYRKESNEVTGKIRVHRAPIADQDVILNPDHTISYVDRSYDPDRYDPSNGQYSTENTGINYAATRGVIERKYRYRNANSMTYVYAQPHRLTAGSYIVELSVKDEYGAWSDWDSDLIVASGSPVLPPNPGFTVDPVVGYRGTPFLINSTASDPQDGPRENLVHQYWIKNLAGGSETLQSDSRTQWTKTFNSTGTFQIRQVVINSYGLYGEATNNVSVVNRRPAANVTTPASANPSSPTEFDTLRPMFHWTYSDADNDPQTQYQLQVIRSNSGGVVALDTGARAGGVPSWVPTADLPEETLLYVQVRVHDGYDWSDWSAPKYFFIDTNKPPTGDFSWNPTLIYEGDTVAFRTAVDDPDRDPLAITYSIAPPAGPAQVFNYHWTYPYPTTGPTLRMETVGVWTIKLLVSDGKEFVTATKTLSVLPLEIAGRVSHTEEWEANRLNYNAKHPDAQRPADWFWAGEAFVLDAVVTDTGASATKPVRVTADAGSGLKKELSGTNPPRLSLWNGALRSEDAGFPLVDLEEGEYTFTFAVTYSNGVVKTDRATIRIVDTVDHYVQVHRVR